MTLLEQPFFHEGKVLTTSFIDYHIPTSMEIPEVSNAYVETIDPDGPYGAKGVCEGFQVPTAPAIVNAIYHATGMRIKEIPVNPAEILKCLKQGMGKKSGRTNERI
jgi:CO/xanthine dehydrogenase Mo-binding subunit